MSNFYEYVIRPLVRTPGMGNVTPVPKFQLPEFGFYAGGRPNLTAFDFIEGALLPGQPIRVFAGLPGVLAGQMMQTPLASEEAYTGYLQAAAGGD